MQEIKRENYTVILEEPEVYVDNQKRGRSGHMSHAMAQFAPGKFIDFNSNCAAVRFCGHSAFGWIEYRISEDYGKTYSPVYELPLSQKLFYEGDNTISVEKAVACDDGTIVALCLRNCQTDPCCCEPWSTPWAITSPDGGKTWTEPLEYSPYPGRTYAATYHKGVVYAMHFCNEHFLGEKPEHQYRIYTSTDNGKTFSELSVVPFDTTQRGYCAMMFDTNDTLHVYAYNNDDEVNMDHAISTDFGKTWTVLEPCYVAKKIRNPQIGYVDGVYILHGRGGATGGFVLYTSEDLTNWDEGVLLIDKKNVGAFYSNNLTLKDEEGNFLLMQYSDTYEFWGKVNVMHQKLRIKR